MKVDVLTESDKLLTRIVIALQAELELKQVDFHGLTKLLSQALHGADDAGELAGLKAEDLARRIEALHAVGWLHIDRSNPHVSAALDGLVVCAALAIPEALAVRLEQRMIWEALK
jgi:hypothetical protein